jgi:hypothetical protein
MINSLWILGVRRWNRRQGEGDLSQRAFVSDRSLLIGVVSLESLGF